MAYKAEISRTNPSCLLFLIDQSGSMQEVLDPSDVRSLETPVIADGQTYTHSASGRTKAQGVADAINRLLQNLVIKCAKSEGVRDYYDVGVVGYGGDNTAHRVAPAFGGELSGKELVPISLIADSPVRIEQRTKKVDDGAGGLVEQLVKFPIWFEPLGSGGTPMCAAIQRAYAILDHWASEHGASFPPIVINISDGEPTDGDPTEPARALQSVCTEDGNVLLFNLHISSQSGASIQFPGKDAALPDQHARLLFGISSILPDYMRNMARSEGYHLMDDARGFVFNADMVSVISFLDIGTRPSNLR